MHSPRQMQKLRRFLAIKEVVMQTLVALNLFLLAVESTHHLSHDQVLAIEIFDIMTAIIFIAEFWFEWHYAKDRKKYVREHWFYLLAAIPVPSSLFEELRVIRTLRILKLFKIFAHMRYEHNTRLFEQNDFR